MTFFEDLFSRHLLKTSLMTCCPRTPPLEHVSKPGPPDPCHSGLLTLSLGREDPKRMRLSNAKRTDQRQQSQRLPQTGHEGPKARTVTWLPTCRGLILVTVDIVDTPTGRPGMVLAIFRGRMPGTVDTPIGRQGLFVQHNLNSRSLDPPYRTAERENLNSKV